MEKIVFTNGCFDLLHPGHLDLLRRARALGTRLIVGLNSDDSVRKIKGPARPLIPEMERAEILKSLRDVDEVRIFQEATPERLIKEIKPDVLVKGGDWPIQQIIGADFVISNGGEVFSLPFKKEFSTSDLVKKIREEQISANPPEISNRQSTGSASDSAIFSFEQHLAVFRDLSENGLALIKECAAIMYKTLRDGKKILVCGNGGSAADAQHLAAELVGRFENERRAFPAIALTTDTSALTAIGNDYGFERIFARQVEGLAAGGDLLIVISTSGNSANVLAAVMEARKKGCRVLGLTGADGKKLAAICDACILVPSQRTARIQEAHIAIVHIWCELIDEKFAEEKNR